MSFRSTIFIIIILVGLAITYFLFLHNSNESTTKITKPKISEIYNLKSNDIQKIDIKYEESVFQDLTIIKDTYSNWKLTSPFVTSADTSKINELISDFVNKQIKETLEVSDYKKYGLEQPTIQIKLSTNQEGHNKTFFIGKKAVNYSVYIKEITEDHIFLIESSALQDLSKSPIDLRDRSVLNINPETITQIQFEKPEIFNCQKDDGIWNIIDPINISADSYQIESILTGLHDLKVSTFEVDGNKVSSLLDNFGLLNPKIKLKITHANGSIDFDIGSKVINSNIDNNNEEDYVYVRSSNIGGIYTVSDKIIELVDKTIHDIRDKRVMDFQREDTIKFEIEKGRQRIIAIKLDDQWELHSNKKSVADTQAVSDLLFGVDSLKAESFITNPDQQLSKYGLNPPNMSLKFTIKGEDKPAILKIGNLASEDTVYVMAETSGVIATVKRGLIDKLYNAENWLSNKQVFTFKIDEPIRISVKYDEDQAISNSRSFTCQQYEGNWRLTSPVKEDANNAEIKAFQYKLIDLRVDEYLNKEIKKQLSISDSITGFNQPYLQITVELQDESNTLQIGNQDSKKRYYGRIKNQPDQTFLINSEVISNLITKLNWIRIQL